MKLNRYDSLFQWFGAVFAIDWQFLKAQCIVESNLDPYAVSKVGAKGLAQFTDAAWQDYGHGDPFNPEESIKAQGAYMAHLLAMYDGDRRLALAAYNAGPAKLKRVGYESLPFETRNYVLKVMALI